MSMNANNITLRYHHLLCLNLYKGLGYSDSFCTQMTEIKTALFQFPSTQIRITAGADDLCTACPHCRQGQCHNGAQHVSEMDKNVSRILKNRKGGSWLEIRELLHQCMDRANFEKCCADCSWFEKGICSFDAFVESLRLNE